ncbi:MAG: choice-of-anchor D domain-containing protein [Bacteroidales bacterium]|nr:choice-of-anchor D domain-containing protein [Bacteroidales bacterium]
MKTLRILLLGVLITPAVIYGQWVIQDPGFPELYEISHIHTLNANDLWVGAKDVSGGGYAPMFARSEVGGVSWQTGYITGDQDLSPAMIFGIDALPYAYAVLYKTNPVSSSQAGIYATFDGGNTWARQVGVFEHPDAFPDIVHFWNSTEGVTIGDPVDGFFDIYTTSNSGADWIKVPSVNIPIPLAGENAIVRTYDAVGDRIWFSTTKGRVFRSDDRGLNWSAFTSPFSSYTRVVFRDSDSGYLQDVGSWETTQLAESNDGGATWQIVEFEGDLLNWDLKYIPGTPATVLSSGAYLRNGLTVSFNGGQSWNRMIDGYKVFVMDWYDWQTGWAGGQIDLQPEGFRPMLFKYTGPGVGGFMVSPLFIDYGAVNVGGSGVMHIILTNYGDDEINVFSITNTTNEFFVDPVSCIVQPNGGQYAITVTFTPGSEGFFSDEIMIECDHPDLGVWSVFVQGNGAPPPIPFTVTPEYFEEALINGEKRTQGMSITNNDGNSYGLEIETNYLAPLQALGWNYGSTPLDSDDGILGSSPDQAMFIKDLKVSGEFNEAFLRMGFDDGVRAWVNGILVIDDKYNAHNVGYWDQEIDITGWITPGTNRITVVVFNGVFAGDGNGGFDCELEVDGQMLIKRGDENYGVLEAMWFYFGETGQQLLPTNDVYARHWWEKDYGRYQWLNLNTISGNTSVDQFDVLGWNYWSAPFGGNEYLLNESPDNAYFIKDVEIETYEEAILYLSFDDGCMVILNGGLLFDFSEEVHGGEYWNKELDISENLIEGRNRFSIIVLNGVYGGGGGGYFDCQLVVDGVNKISRGDLFNGEPEAFWHVYGQAGQVLTPPNDASGRLWWEMDYASGGSPLTSSLGWQYNSTPVYENENLLTISPDNAQFIKDIETGYVYEAILYLGFDDGCRVWINGILEFDFYDEVHGLNYWDHELDVSWMLQPGRNRIAIEVYNGIYGGGAFGGFDCQLIVNGVEIIKRGDENYNEPEAMWFMFGEAGEILTPPADANGLDWYHKDYGISASQPTQNMEDIIEGWQTKEVMVLFDATGLTPGDYSATIKVINTGTQEIVEVPVNLIVMEEASLFVTPVVLDYGEYFLGFPEMLKLKITNQGALPLEIFEVYPLDGGITIVWDEFIIEPSQSIYPEIYIDPGETGPFSSGLVITSSDPLHPYAFITIHAECKFAPDFEIPDIDYLFASLPVGGNEIQTFDIANFGENPSILEFTIPQAMEGKNHRALKKVPLQTKESKRNTRIDPNQEQTPVYHYDDLLGVKPAKIRDKMPATRAGDVNIFFDDMENGVNSWQIENYQETEDQWHQINIDVNAPEHVWWCGNELTGTYYNSNIVTEAIISPSVRLPHWGNTIYLEFEEYYDVEEGFDWLYVDISTDGGENWWRIRDDATGIAESWIVTTLDISEYAENEIKIRFLFDTGDEIANSFPGWFIDDVRIYSPGFPFLSIGPSQAAVLSGEYQNMIVTFDASGYNPGFYIGYFLIHSNDPDEPFYYLPAHMEVTGEPETHFIELPAGWGGLSSYLQPLNPAMEDVFAPVTDELIIAQTMTEMYYPGQNINTIGNWYQHAAFKVKTLAECTLAVEGYVENNKNVWLDAGWSLLPVVTPEGADPAGLLSPVNGFVIAKDVAGTGVFWPEFGINSLGILLPGKAYYVLLTAPGVVDFTGMKSSINLTVPHERDQNLSGLEITPTPSTHTIAILPEAFKGFEQRAIIGAYDQDGNCFGATVYNCEIISLTVFGDDPITAEKDGFFEGEMIFFKNLSGLNPAHAGLTGLNPTFDQTLPQSDGHFTENGLSAITGFESSNGVEFAEFVCLINIFPNPSDGVVNITGLQSGAKIIVTDVRGQVVLITETLTAGQTSLDLTDFNAGVYFTKIEINGQRIFRKIVLK